MTEEPDATFGGLLPEHVNMLFPPTPAWGGGVKSRGWNGHFVTYPSCKYCNDTIHCSHPNRKFMLCDTHNYIKDKEDVKIDCPIAGIPEGEE